MRMEPAPSTVRVAGLLVALEGITGIGFGIALTGRLSAGGPGNNVLGEVSYFVLLGLGVGFAGLLLAAGKRGARTPAVVVQLVLLGIAWYLVSGSGRLLIGLLVAALGLVVIVLLFVGRSRRWAMGVGEFGPAEDGSDSAAGSEHHSGDTG